MARKPRRRNACGRFAVIKLAVTSAGRKRAPMRRSQALDTSTLLINEHRGVPAHCVPKRLNKIRYLCWRTHIPLEDNEAPWFGVAEKRALTSGNAQSRQSGDERAYRHRRGLLRACRKGQVWSLVPLNQALAAGGPETGAQIPGFA